MTTFSSPISSYTMGQKMNGVDFVKPSLSVLSGGIFIFLSRPFNKKYIKAFMEQ